MVIEVFLGRPSRVKLTLTVDPKRLSEFRSLYPNANLSRMFDTMLRDVLRETQEGA